jgi:DNA repair protein RadC
VCSVIHLKERTLTSNPRELPDLELEDIVLTGARSLGTGEGPICAEPRPRYVATPERRKLCVVRLLECAAELDRRYAARRLLQAVLTTPIEVQQYLKAHFRGRDTECFVGLFLDAQHRVIAIEELFRGTLTQTSVYPREVVRRALAHNAGALIVSHNHPSGVPEPSRADEFLTGHLKSALGLVDVRLLDHIVVAGEHAVSLADRGLI